MKKPIIVGFWIVIVIFSAIAIPVLAQEIVIDDFEDGDISDWSPVETDDNAEIESTIVYEGNFSIKVTAIGPAHVDETNRVEKSISRQSYDSFVYRHYLTEDSSQFVLKDGNLFIITVNIGKDDNAVSTQRNELDLNGNTGFIVPENEWLIYRLHNIDYANNQYDFELWNDTHLLYEQDSISFDFGQEASSFNNIELINHYQSEGDDNSGPNYWDLITANSTVVTPTPEPTPTPTPPPSNLHLNINNQWMDHNTKQIFNVEFVNGTAVSDVTQEATVQSSQPNNITVFQLNETLLSIDNESINTVVTINASYQGHNDSIDIFVGNRTLENIEKCIGFTKIICGIGVDEPNNFGGLGSSMQWIYVIILFATGIGGAFKNPWIGLGMMILGMVLLFIMGEIDLGTVLASTLLGVYFGLVLSQGESITIENITD